MRPVAVTADSGAGSLSFFEEPTVDAVLIGFDHIDREVMFFLYLYIRVTSRAQSNLVYPVCRRTLIRNTQHSVVAVA